MRSSTKKYKLLKKKQREIQKLKTTLTELKNSIGSFMSNVDQSEERIIEHNMWNHPEQGAKRRKNKKSEELFWIIGYH